MEPDSRASSEDGSRIQPSSPGAARCSGRCSSVRYAVVGLAFSCLIHSVLLVVLVVLLAVDLSLFVGDDDDDDDKCEG
ncbi:uncharacterized protein BJX67DRAFT_361461 [Aspergillus lucknowensis]|uniref:Transmembrane protein n=1 Tax=Aspergillus lucknowensis TaxID=176173 RepID=A0ABR4LLU6_9EURO